MKATSKKMFSAIVVTLIVLAMALTACGPAAEVVQLHNSVSVPPAAPVKNGNVVRGAFLPTPTSVPTQVVTPPAATPDPSTIDGQEAIWLTALKDGMNPVVSTTNEVFFVKKTTVDGINYYQYWDSKLVWMPFAAPKVDTNGKLVWGGDKYAPDQALSKEMFFNEFAFFNYGYDLDSIYQLLQNPPLILNDEFSSPMATPVIPTKVP
jgi:hypothetical protein